MRVYSSFYLLLIFPLVHVFFLLPSYTYCVVNSIPVFFYLFVIYTKVLMFSFSSYCVCRKDNSFCSWIDQGRGPVIAESSSSNIATEQIFFSTVL
ncbi:hypothetical protein BDF14DRAFT_198133 [Spinellus fusiger]|nr:hypothetical protein BDF14DRAFT_198133 [Spinellus fusiger]